MDGEFLMSSYNLDYLNSLHQYDIYSVLQCFTDDCLRKIAKESEVSVFVMNAALQAIRMRQDVELRIFEWECQMAQDRKLHARWAKNQAQLDATTFGLI